MEVFYLKINNPADITWNYLNMWLDIIQQFPDSKTYIICDNSHLQNSMINNIKNNGVYEVEFIPSARDSEELKYIIDNAIVPHWKPAAYAHLTTFLHSRDKGYKDFWNIDADDLGLYAKLRKIAKLLNNVKNFANKNGIDMISLDMWRTAERGNHWSFGLAYTNNSVSWLEFMRNHCTDKDFFYKYENVSSKRNIDWFCTYLREIGVARLETFCVENLRVIHDASFIYKMPLFCGLRYWKNGKCYFPVLCNDFNMGDCGSLPIPDDIINFDIRITAEESMRYLKSKCIDIHFPLIEKINGIVDSEVTLILPLYGSCKNVKISLESLLSQKFSDFRLIVTDAGLNNNALKICQEMENNFDGRMKILTGVPKEKLLEAGLQAAKGRYVMFINGNEVFLPETLEILHNIIESTRADVVHTSNYFLQNYAGNLSVVNEEQGWGENLQPLIVFKSIRDKIIALSRNMLSTSIYNKLIRREFLEEEKISLPYDTEIICWTFILQCLCLSEKYIRIAKPLYTKLAPNTPKEISQEDFNTTIKSIELSKANVDRIVEEVFFFDEYDKEKNFLIEMYKNFVAYTLQKSLDIN